GRPDANGAASMVPLSTVTRLSPGLSPRQIDRVAMSCWTSSPWPDGRMPMAQPAWCRCPP
ncbi:hypothetical protein, partial [Aquitalea magnusonii]|uniref:hypothetical protein n=1 Tax=Aquitalea magnusonii TaxID=332411 RepID=UPI001EFBBBDD